MLFAFTDHRSLMQDLWTCTLGFLVGVGTGLVLDGMFQVTFFFFFFSHLEKLEISENILMCLTNQISDTKKSPNSKFFFLSLVVHHQIDPKKPVLDNFLECLPDSFLKI